jgi:membrane-associated phospholipid phosphatase
VSDTTEEAPGEAPARGTAPRSGELARAVRSRHRFSSSHLRIAAPHALIRVTVLAVCCVAAYLLFVLSSQGRMADASAFASLMPLIDVFGATADVVRQVIPFVLAALVVVLAAAALARQRWDDVARSVVLVASSLVATEGLKFLLPRPEAGGSVAIVGNSYPSGHVAVTLSLALVVVILSPTDRWHVWLALLTGAATVGVAWCSVLSTAHRASDVIGSALLVGFLVQVVFWRKIAMVDSRARLGAAILLCAAAGAALVVVGGVFAAGPPVLAAAGIPGWLLLCAAPAAYSVMLAPTGPLILPPTTDEDAPDDRR